MARIGFYLKILKFFEIIFLLPLFIKGKLCYYYLLLPFSLYDIMVLVLDI